ncbi:zinc-binding alcohol dehydrogenase [Micromonospora sp. ATCC 39149]|uniref:zinc-binding dehydrogenase n=1 Tax=Micromonospora sp. (strain ATCC 39149 / NRRL 15099 / SCC 1413) TaxID=219305 RepID=UPI0001A5119E|nr:zinc-binding dehydrogenase [Micromonospora sp. ATCC 39149]EEP70213.1 zinc-binding alcohol dehydrogenase [Micromonospora sp. ATCC 39149]
MVAHHRNVVPLGARDVPLEIVGPLGCAMQTGAGAVLTVLRPGAGATVAVIGAGAVGLAAVMAARLAGCATILAVDLHEARLALAGRLGATDALRAGDELAGRVVAATGGGVDFVVDAVGSPETARDALGMLRAGGTAVVAGSAGAGRTVTLEMTQLMGRTVRGVIEGDCVPAVFIPQLLDLHLAGRFPFHELIRTYSFDEIGKAVEDSRSGVTVKPVLVF